MASPGGSDGAPNKGEDLLASSSTSKSTSRDSNSAMGTNRTTQPRSFTIRMLKEITDNFSEKRALGQGAYGKVYRGVLDSGEEIAVKLLNNNSLATSDDQFQHEFDNLMMLNHPNIVRFVGYSYDTQRQHADFEKKIVFAETTYRALCFEFMHMGTLERHLSDEHHGLDWKIRYKIIKGACEGLKYLQKGFEKPMFHLDIKPDNILLDENMTPKLADFGLSKPYGEEKTMVTNSPLGTMGYIPPEYIFGKAVSTKSDVFSMGVVITQIIAGPKGSIRSYEMPRQEFLDQVHKNWRNRLEATCSSSSILEAYCDQVIICTELGLSSMEFDKDNRPSIVDIINTLNETETTIEKAIAWSAISRSSMPVKSQEENDDDLVKVEAFARNKAIQFTETCDEFPVLVRVTGSPWRRRAEEMPCLRAGMDVVVAVNVMRNEVKEAMMMLVDRLSPNDRLSIVYVMPDIEEVMELTYMSDHGRNVARLKISELADCYDHQKYVYTRPALFKAAKILQQREVEEEGISSRTGCILHVWQGRMDTKIHEQQISEEFPVHTIALPDSTRSDNDMKQVAGMTSGSCSLIDKNDNLSNSIKDGVTLFIAWITSDATIRITLQADEGVTISSIVSGWYGNLISTDKQSATVNLYSYAGERKNFIVYLTVPQGKEKLVTVGGRYRSMNTSKELVGVDVVMLRRPRRKCFPDEVFIHPKVAAELLRIRLMEGIAKQNQDLSRNNLRLLLDEIKNSHEGHATPEEILSDLEEKVAEMTDQNGFNRDYMLSCLNCCQLQRSTTKNIPPNIGAFQILEQQRADEHNNYLVNMKIFTKSNAIMHSERCNEFPVLVRVTVEPWRHGWEMPRHGVDVVAVLDISASMQGETLDLVKQSMMIVIDKLGPNDRLSIVSFQARKHRLIELAYMSDDHGHGRDAVRKISQLKASSGRYMGDIASVALQEGVQILLDRGVEESSSRLGCMMLLSDGKYPEILQTEISRQFPVHTFGLGAEHNPKVMKYIADMTSGTYSFVDQDISNIKDALALFITGLTSIAATSLTITLRVHSGIAISSIESGNYIHHVKPDKMSGTIIVDHIYAGEQKEFIVNLKVGNARKKLMTIGGQYTSFKSDKSLADVDISVQRPWYKLSPGDLAIHPDVAAELTRIRLLNGVLDMLKAQKMTTQGLQKLWDMIKNSEEGGGAPEETLSSLSMDVAAINTNISGIPYMLSWLSCHKWQRPTTKGTPSNSSAFQTIGQHTNEDTNLVKVETFTRSKAIPSDDPRNKFPVLVRVMVAPQQGAEEMPHAGVDMVAVLDASGGMQGEKLERLKEAMIVVIDKLHAEDRLSIVSFNTYENRLTRLTYMTDHGRDVARLKIKKLVASGQGDIGAALREGAEILYWREAESARRVGSIVFLSDCKNSEIFETEIRPEFPVHTFGLGTDHNPNTMKYIADITSGTYSFVNQDIGMIKDALTLFITGLTSVAAMSMKVMLRTEEGITISSIESGGYINHVENNQLGTVDIDNIYAGERKDFIVYLRVAEGKKDLMTVGGRYLSHDTVKHLAYRDVSMQQPHQEGLPEDLAIQPDVAAELVRIRLKEGIAAMLEQGASNIGLQQLWDGIIDSDEGRGAPEEFLSGLRMDITEMKRDIENPEEYKKTGLPYMLSWLTSHKWQRATTKGAQSSSGSFQTTEHGDEGTTLSHQSKEGSDIDLSVS